MSSFDRQLSEMETAQAISLLGIISAGGSVDDFARTTPSSSSLSSVPVARPGSAEWRAGIQLCGGGTGTLLGLNGTVLPLLASTTSTPGGLSSATVSLPERLLAAHLQSNAAAAAAAAAAATPNLGFASLLGHAAAAAAATSTPLATSLSSPLATSLSSPLATSLTNPLAAAATAAPSVNPLSSTLNNQSFWFSNMMLPRCAGGGVLGGGGMGGASSNGGGLMGFADRGMQLDMSKVAEAQALARVTEAQASLARYAAEATSNNALPSLTTTSTLPGVDTTRLALLGAGGGGGGGASDTMSTTDKLSSSAGATTAAAAGFDYSGAKQTGPEPFPEKLHRMLVEVEAIGRSDVISFAPNGRAFQIHDPDTFFEEIVPEYFKQTKLSSFKRQLNLYGFKLIGSGPCKGGYFHPYFIKDRPDLIWKIKRNDLKAHVKHNKANSKDCTESTTPDFYKMPPILSNEEAKARGKKDVGGSSGGGSMCMSDT